jgi:hypothetical protein
MKEFLINQKGFNPEKVDIGLKKMLKYQVSMGRTQVRLDNFFKSSGAPPPASSKPSSTQSKSSTPGKPAFSSFRGKKK